ncbi:FKBP-type peptidyl-prolyl cis-trans isomerase [Actinophytocola sp.]|uniref:FKBP-type peptidyl-prolyl cis-trans isomerase n=1 Tax=Actinophytocola sp. TaxID=1872138 RepID=UPI0025B858C4|nr:FKBP-type peptidyl-prolyl cis-trans isomerase [Actinophytocola sp.]
MSKVLVVVATVMGALTLGGCVSGEQRSSEPPGDTVSFPPPSAPEEAPPEESSEPPANSGVNTAVECTAEDITVTGAADQHPEITLPDNCSAPTKLIVADLAPGTGPEAVEGAAMQANYALTAWSSGEEIETSYPPSGQGPLPIDTVGSGLIEAWNQGLVGMRQGGRRLIVAPPELAYAGSGNELENETLVFVVDAVQVTPA